MRLASCELAIDAPAEVVWRLLTAGDGLVCWAQRPPPIPSREDHERGWAYQVHAGAGLSFPAQVRV